jgi:hypothetical protein
MTFRRFILVDASGIPVSPDWTPMLDDDEVPPANQALRDRNSPWHWEPKTECTPSAPHCLP